MKKKLSIALSLLLVLGLAACGGNQSSGASSSTADGSSDSAPADSQEEVEISMWIDTVDPDGLQTTPIAEEMTRRTGVRINAIKGDSEKFKVLQGAGDLPGIIFINGSTVPVNQLIPLDDLIESNGRELKENYNVLLEYSRNFITTDGKLYYLPVHQYRVKEGEDLLPSQMGSAVSWFGRWDVYAEAGYPEAGDLDSFLNMMKLMQDTYPETPEGKKTYALSGWTDWGVWPFFIVSVFNGGNTDVAYATIYNKETGKIQNLYDSAEFWDGLYLHYRAYNMGILDPDIFINNFDTYYEKVKAGQVLTLHASWWVTDINNFFAANGSPEMGFELIPNETGNISDVYYDEWPLGWLGSYAHAITTNCEYPEKAMDFINFCYSDEGAKLIYRGIEGEDWETVDGVPQLTQTYLDGTASNEKYRSMRGFTYQRLVGPDTSQLASDGYPYDLTASVTEFIKQLNPIDIEFSTHYGDYQYPGEAVAGMVEQGKMKTFDYEYQLAPSLVKEPSQETQQVLAEVEEYFKANIAKLIMAKDDAEFESLKAQMIADINAKGYDKALTEMKTLYAEAEESANSFDVNQ